MILKPGISPDDFDYPLPEEKIAQFPLEQRDSSKLLVWKNGLIGQDVFSNIGTHLPGNSVLVFNDTKVIRARLLFPKQTGSVVEIFCLDPILPTREVNTSLCAKGSATWECLIGNLKRWKSGLLIKEMEYGGRKAILSADKKDDLGDGCFSVAFSWKPDNLTFSEVLEMAGQVPLPPYIRRAAGEGDTSDYQTVYAKNDGSVAAPTAGLHFTDELLEELRIKNLQSCNVTLHVGLGTFRPVSAPDITQHRMHEEKIIVGKETIDLLLGKSDNHVIAVGTTTVRTLESLYWIGVKIITDKAGGIPSVAQWDPYDPRYNRGIPSHEALEAVREMLDNRNESFLSGETQVIIIPGYQFRMIRGMITNFHLPKSTLLMLVAAFAGDSWKRSYDYALSHDFRFLSYGDASFFLKTTM